MFFIFLTLICILIYYYGTKNQTYWSRRGVKHDPPLPFFGNLLTTYFLRKTISDYMVETYKRYPDEPYVGYYTGARPYLILKDPELIGQTLEKDFSYFQPRVFDPLSSEFLEPLLNNIFFNYGDSWKLQRQRMTPAFTTSKLKAMFPLIRERSEKLKNKASINAVEGRVVDVKELLTRFTLDFVAASALGLDVDTLNDEQSELRKLGKRMFTTTAREALILILQTVFPRIGKEWGLVSPSLERDTLSLTRGILHQRNYKPSGRNDMVDLLLEMKEKGKLVGNSIENRNEDGTPLVTEIEFNDELIASHIMLFFGAGFETAATSASYTLHQLAYHPEIQARCQEEIDSVLEKYEGQLCYESVKELKYLEMALLEGLRMYPPLGFIIRKCSKRYTLPGTNVTLDEGVAVTVSLQALHNDEKYFDNPTQFRPERFAPDRVRDIPKHVYLPFGTGPRVCIGERLAYVQTLSALASVLQVCSVEPAKSSVRSPPQDPTSLLVQASKGGLPLLFVPRTK